MKIEFTTESAIIGPLSNTYACLFMHVKGKEVIFVYSGYVRNQRCFTDDGKELIRGIHFNQWVYIKNIEVSDK